MKDFFSELLKDIKKNKGAFAGLLLILIFILLAIFAPLLSVYAPDQVIEGALRLPPNSHFQNYYFIFGTDDIGRDLFTRLLYGSRISLLVGLSVVVLAASLGTSLGLISGYFGGWTDRIISRAMDFIMALPSVLFAIVIVAVLGPGLMNAIVAVSIVALPNFVRLIRAQVLAEKNKQYVQAAQLYGASHLRILFKEILPNCMAPLIVQGSLGFSDGILNCAALGFLGLGAQAPTPEWGTMLSDARSFLESSPWMVNLPGLCILTVVLSFNLLGDGLRDALDPRLKNRS
ncbi:MAG TPA: ABC transporter permease [Pseudobdellovibrionaceae bacterium]|jgi:peptide/nickel transport system permease protein/dipeptide transport system permease protein